ncbi:XRE family transcriptional regulator [Curvibacter sp. RS43]|uniref:XRE family transcriptional regulator n=1 Tax=Curvibacter microcysteis TaxID=3026419 RepID=A0ABT5MK36_9BURK|nr:MULTISPECIES: XRE family transcriptional regulator [unclassified Curvibacter]MDD0812823.1 XRE family transcriptional regulator [Curvibacter sp. RS43]MDD0816950.1 XRE family transcriptional regulator [Curvibacter sp. HBC28]
MVGSGIRLRQERERLGFSQSDFAALVPVTRKTMFNWESGAGQVASEALGVWAGVGLDVLYVITGQRALSAAGLSSRHLNLLSLFDTADEAGRLAIETAAVQAQARR